MRDAHGLRVSDMCWFLQDVLRPLLAACGIRSPKLASISLTSIQKLLAKGLLGNEDIQAIMQALEQVLSVLMHCQAKHLFVIKQGLVQACNQLT